MELAKILIIPPNRDYIIALHQNGTRFKMPRSHAPHVRVDDICVITQLQNRLRLRILTEDDEAVMMDHPDRKRLVPYGFFHEPIVNKGLK